MAICRYLELLTIACFCPSQDKPAFMYPSLLPTSGLNPNPPNLDPLKPVPTFWSVGEDQLLVLAIAEAERKKDSLAADGSTSGNSGPTTGKDKESKFVLAFKTLAETLMANQKTVIQIRARYIFFSILPSCCTIFFFDLVKKFANVVNGFTGFFFGAGWPGLRF